MTIVLMLILLILINFLSELNQSHASDDFKVRVWLADVKADTGIAQVCIDVPETFAWMCRKINASATEEAIPVGEFNFTLAVDGGIYTLPSTQVPINTTVVICAYLFKYENGECEEIINHDAYSSRNVILRINYSPVFYDEEDKRLYRYGQNYRSETGLIFSFEHESIAGPDTKGKQH